MEKVTQEFLIEKGFEKIDRGIGWDKYRKNGFELVSIPLTNGGSVIGFEYQFESKVKYKWPLRIEELEQLYKILTGKEL